MGFIRGGLVIIIAVLLLISLLIGNVLLVLSSSLEYENVQEKMVPVIKEIIYGSVNVSDMQESFNIMKQNCEQGISEIIVNEEEYPFKISCDDISIGTAESILDKQLEEFMQENYYKEYNCGLIDCFKQEGIPFFLVSKHTKDYIQNKYYYVLAISVILLIVMSLFIENKKNILVIAGILLIVSSLPFMKLSAFSFGGDYSSQIFSMFFEQAYVIFWWMFIIGLVVLGLGIGLRFWSFEEIKRMFERKGSGKSKKKVLK